MAVVGCFLNSIPSIITVESIQDLGPSVKHSPLAVQDVTCSRGTRDFTSLNLRFEKEGKSTVHGGDFLEMPSLEYVGSEFSGINVLLASMLC